LVALIDIGGRCEVNLGNLVKKLNSLQPDLFKFELFSPPLKDLGGYMGLHNYSDEQFFGALKNGIRGTDYGFGIGITHEELPESSFNRHEENEGVGVITFDDASEYIPGGRTLEQYLGYLILCEAFCIVGGQHFEHDQRRYCLFDMCFKKKDLIRCLSEPTIDNICRGRLTRAGFSRGDLEQANRVLAWVGSTSLRFAAGQAVNNAITMMLLGSLVTYLLRALSVTVTPPWFWQIAVGLLAGVVVSALLNYRYRKPPPTA